MPATVVRVLVVDSDPTGRQEICRALERSGFELLETSSAAQASEVLRGEPPGAVVVDTLLSDHPLRRVPHDPRVAGRRTCRS
jgi:DNA-binding response OmpR family regulator